MFLEDFVNFVTHGEQGNFETSDEMLKEAVWNYSQYIDEYWPDHTVSVNLVEHNGE